MLYDKRWEAKTLPSPSRILSDAADYMDEHGWCQHVSQDEQGRVCLLGAVMVTAGYTDRNEIRIVPILDRMDKLAQNKALSCNILFDEWNDCVCSSKEEAVAFLREAAQLKDDNDGT